MKNIVRLKNQLLNDGGKKAIQGLTGNDKVLLRAYLSDGLYDVPEVLRESIDFLRLTVSDEDLFLGWQEHREEILAEYSKQRPGFRPLAWWKFDAPRMTQSDIDRYGFPSNAYFIKDLPDPRVRYSDFQASFEKHTQYTPAFKYGIPYSFHTLAPQRVESSAAYLKRHGLLTQAEENKLKPEAFEPVMVNIGCKSTKCEFCSQQTSKPFDGKSEWREV